MLCFVLPIVCLMALIGFAVLAVWLLDEDHGVLGLLSIAVAVVTFFGTVGFTINAFDYGDYLMNPDVRIEYTTEKHDSLVQLLANYNMMLENDINASESYMAIHKEVRDFNDAVRRADRWQDTWWAEGWLYDPTYVNVNTIPIN